MTDQEKEDPTKDRISVCMVNGEVVCLYVNNIRVAGRKPWVAENPVYHELYANVGEIRAQLKRHPRVKKRIAKRQYRVMNYGDGVGEHQFTVESAANSKSAFLRRFYELYPGANRGHWRCELVEHGANIYNHANVRVVSFIAK